MKEEKEQISKEEYQEILKQLDEIMKIRENLKDTIKSQKYKAHFPLTEDFQELLINLLRNNNEIDKEINLTIKNFLKTLPPNKKNIKQIATIIYAEKERLEKKKEINLTEMPEELTSITSRYPNFQTTYISIQDSINKKNANNFLISQVKLLQSRLETLQVKKAKYKKKKTLSLTRVFHKKRKD